MKAKLLLSFAALVFTATASMAQFHIGVKGGANINKIDGSSFSEQFSYGYHLGGFAEIGLGRKFAIQPEVLFNQYSTTVTNDIDHVYEDVFNSDQSKVKLNYLSIPILLNYKLIGNFMTLQAGPQFSVLMDQNKKLFAKWRQGFLRWRFCHGRWGSVQAECHPD